jgi:putative transposase
MVHVWARPVRWLISVSEPTSAGPKTAKSNRTTARSRPRPEPANKLTPEERQCVLDICHQPEYASLPPGQIVPRLADQGTYIASESSFYRILHEADEQHHRGRSRQPQSFTPPQGYCATGPNQVWSWDITWLPAPIRGMFFYLYMMVDVYSRKIVGWEVHPWKVPNLGRPGAQGGLVRRVLA